jgi:hypothetical protein
MTSSSYLASLARRGRRESGISNYSESSPFADQNRAVIMSTLRSDMDPDVRQALLADPRNAIQAMTYWHGTLCILTRPTLAVDPISGEAVIVGSMTDEIGVTIPVSIPVARYHAWGTSLIPRADVEAFGLPVALEAPDSLEGPALAAEDEVEREAPSMARLHCDDMQDPRIAGFPIFLHLPQGITFPGGTLATVEGTGAIDERFPVFETWRKAHRYVADHNAGFSLTCGGTIFDPTDISTQPFAHLRVVTQVKSEFTMLPPTSSLFGTVKTTLAALESQVWTQIVSELPPQVEQPPAAAPAAQFGVAEMTAFASIVKQPPLSRKDAEHLATSKDIQARYSLMFAKVEIDAFGQPVVKLARCSPLLIKLLESTRPLTALRELQEVIVNAITVAGQSKNRLDDIVTFHPDIVGEAFTKCIRQFQFRKDSLNLGPERMHTQISIVAFAGPQTESIVFKERVIEGAKTLSQEIIDDDKFHLVSAKRAADLYVCGKIETTAHVQSCMANARNVLSELIEDFDLTLFWMCVNAYEELLHSDSGKAFGDMNRDNPFVALNCLIDVQDILNLFVAIGCNPSYRAAVVRGDPISPQVYLDAKTLATNMLTAPGLAIQKMNALQYADSPLCSKTLPQFAATQERGKRKLDESGGYQHDQRDFGRRQQRESGGSHSYQRDQREFGGRQRDTGGSHRGQRDSGGYQQESGGRQSRQRDSGGPQRDPARRPNDSPPNQSRLDDQKRKGIAIWTGQGSPPPCNIHYKKEGSRSAENLCLDFVAQNLACRFGARCQKHHVSQLASMPPEAQTKFCAYVQATPNFAFAPGRGPPGTS